MKRLCYFLGCLFFLVFSGSLAAVEVPGVIIKEKLVGERVTHSYVGIPSQLFIGQWLPGEVILQGGGRRMVNALLYNGYHDELIYRSADNQYIKLEKASLKGFTLENHLVAETLYFERVQIPIQGFAKPQWVFAQVLHEGSFLLYAYRNIKSTGKEVIHQGNSAYERRLYKPNTTYFLKLPDGQWISFSRLRRKTLQELFPGKIDLVRSIQRSNQIRIRNNEQELIRFLILLAPVLVDE